jgi:hypothetical protein
MTLGASLALSLKAEQRRLRRIERGGKNNEVVTMEGPRTREDAPTNTGRRARTTVAMADNPRINI